MTERVFLAQQSLIHSQYFYNSLSQYGGFWGRANNNNISFNVKTLNRLSTFKLWSQKTHQLIFYSLPIQGVYRLGMGNKNTSSAAYSFSINLATGALSTTLTTGICQPAFRQSLNIDTCHLSEK